MHREKFLSVLLKGTSYEKIVVKTFSEKKTVSHLLYILYMIKMFSQKKNLQVNQKTRKEGMRKNYMIWMYFDKSRSYYHYFNVF